ncbi:3'(2'),5'-bisphosphate nucleotidase CysQ [Rhodoblastus sp.]|uniref:3'(2'),5'-bisphosphate nucleotidase CysQ n=1 Tax=Rhodoblastus sp. TaxID=1962975 RepID=UPI0025D975FC|nr:3'(2'),5'-bisphosphate nucleotidase CysQ [Rhodoblastus sp.]
MTDRMQDDDALAEIFAFLALKAGAAIMRVRASGARARIKSDSSPVCDADLLAEEIIIEGLVRLAPRFPIVAEELCASGGTPEIDGGPFFLVDPLDGTREFLEGRDCFSVNIALIRDGVPAVGVVFAPARGEMFVAGSHAWTFAAEPEGGMPPRAEWRELHVRSMPERDAVAVASRSHLDTGTKRFLGRLTVRDIVPIGSSLKFCLLASGEADVYPRFGPTMEWDTAAGDAVLRRAGGVVLDLSGAPALYGKAAREFANGPFIAWGDPSAAARFRASGVC